jgi:hypothetical protein
MTTDGAPDLAGLCVELADELDEVSSSADGGVTAYARGGAVFARVSGLTMEIRLPADIADAALRTPDTVVDPDDRGWVRFTPADDERHVIDRATAWFQTAWRHAADN